LVNLVLRIRVQFECGRSGGQVATCRLFHSFMELVRHGGIGLRRVPFVVVILSRFNHVSPALASPPWAEANNSLRTACVNHYNSIC
jgi:hypothetical protein